MFDSPLRAFRADTTEIALGSHRLPTQQSGYISPASQLATGLLEWAPGELQQLDLAAFKPLVSTELLTPLLHRFAQDSGVFLYLFHQRLPRRQRQLFGILLTNALSPSEPGNHLLARVDIDASKHTRITLDSISHHLALCTDAAQRYNAIGKRLEPLKHQQPAITHPSYCWPRQRAAA